MKKVTFAGFALFSLFVIASIFACFTGLEPAKKADEKNRDGASVTLIFPVLPIGGNAGGIKQSRAIVQEGGYLYLQIGIAANDAALYGPYIVSTNDTVTIDNLPIGTHAYFAVIYTDTVQTELSPVIAESTDSSETAFRTKLAASLATGSAASCKLLSNIALARDKTTSIRCTLIPVTEDTIDCGYGTAVHSVDTASTGNVTAQKFISLWNFAGNAPASIYRKTTKISVTNTSSKPCTIQRFALYNPDGTLSASVTEGLPGTLPVGASATYLSIAQQFAESAAWLYVEYSGDGLRITANSSWQTGLLYVTADGQAVRSIDGTLWSTTATGLASCSDVAFGASGFVACGKNSAGSIAIAQSSDGYAWTVKVTDSVNPSLLSGRLGVRSADGAMVMTYISGATSMASSSTDGWATANTIGTNGGNCGNVYVNGKWYTTYSGSGWYGSSNGITWATAGLGSAAMYTMSTIDCINGVFLAGGGNPSGSPAKTIFRSTDNGTSFGTVISLPSVYANVEAFIPTTTGRILAVGGGTSADKIYYSDNGGATWTATTAPAAAGTFTGGCQAAGKIFASDSSGQIFASTDNGISFAQITVPTTSAIKAMSLSSY